MERVREILTEKREHARDKRDRLSSLPTDVLHILCRILLEDYRENYHDGKPGPSVPQRTTNKKSALHHPTRVFQALRSCCKRLATASDDVRTSIHFPEEMQDKVEAYLLRLPELSAVSVVYGYSGPKIIDSLATLHHKFPKLSSLVLRLSFHQPGIWMEGQTDKALLSWCETLHSLELNNAHCTPSSNTGGGSCLQFLSQLTSLRRLTLSSVCPFLQASDLVGCSSLVKITLLGRARNRDVVLPLSHSQMLDLSSCPSLQQLTCNSCLLTELYVEGLTSLQLLDCRDNYLQILDVSFCTALREVDCQANHLESLDITNHPTLQSLKCSSNILSDVQLTGCTQLSLLECRGGTFTHLDLSACPALETLYLRDSNVNDLCLDDCIGLKDVDLSGSKALRMLSFQGSTRLERLNLARTCNLAALDVSGCSALAELVCEHSLSLRHLRLAGCSSLWTLLVQGCEQLQSLSLAGCDNLRTLGCSGCPLQVLDISMCVHLQDLVCSKTSITQLDVSYAASAMVHLYMEKCPLQVLSAWGCSRLEVLECRKCPQLRYLDIRGCVSLKKLSCLDSGEFSSAALRKARE